MQHPSLSAFLAKLPSISGKGAIAVILLEDNVEVDATIDHHLSLGFENVFVFGQTGFLPNESEDIHMISHEIRDQHTAIAVVNAISKAKPGSWVYSCYNAEFLYYPFCETRNVNELFAFSLEERRSSIFNFVIDLYSTDLGQDHDGVSRERAFLDKTGYYALGRKDSEGHTYDRQMEFFGGLKWRYEQHVPWQRRRIDRPGLFRAKKGLTIDEDWRFNDEEYNTYECPWHNNLTTATCSFRTAKALLSNPGSRHLVGHFWWENSEAFSWKSNQLMELGLMEPGQWF